ncbi:ABC transporter substrate-binding protein [Rhodosalinus sp. FB01]|uniref:ABC transporter substrate-binding protein n=1 Tax=Rhodosalinus sp. FB01 TaxID=3239194 RepID=UPI0035234EAB
MSGCARRSDRRLRRAAAALGLWLGLSVAAAGPGGADEAPPARVVSINLCTDQLAMMLAAPGQLHSVTNLATDPRVSAMAEEAAAFPSNRGAAEDIYLMRPDLVLAGRYTAQPTVAMLRRLGIPVVVFDPALSLDDVRTRMVEMGAALGQEEAAARAVAIFDARRAALRESVSRRPSAALYYANGYTAGDRSLAGEILAAAGFENVAEAAGLSAGGRMPLEVLALAAPEAVVTARPYPGASRAEDILDHPGVRALREGRAAGAFADRDWICGTPHVLAAIESLAELRRTLPPGGAE